MTLAYIRVALKLWGAQTPGQVSTCMFIALASRNLTKLPFIVSNLHYCDFLNFRRKKNETTKFSKIKRR
jgi:hypothetical protein